MQSINVNVKSWHYRLATVYGQTPPWRMTDSCSYVGAVLKGILLAVVIITALSMVLAPWAHAVAWLVAIVQTGQHVETNGFWIGILAELAVVATIFLIIGYMALRDRLQARNTLANSTVYQLYDSWRNRFCKPIEFK